MHLCSENGFRLSTGDWDQQHISRLRINIMAYLKVERFTISSPQNTVKPPSKNVFTVVHHHLCFPVWYQPCIAQELARGQPPSLPSSLALPFHLYPCNFPNVSCCFNYTCFHNFAHATHFSLCLCTLSLQAILISQMIWFLDVKRMKNRAQLSRDKYTDSIKKLRQV